MARISNRERRAQALARVRLDAAFQQAEQKILKIIAEETTEMVFGFMMDAGAILQPEKIAQVRAIIRAFRNDREICTSKIVEIRRRQLSVLLQDEPPPTTIARFARWAKI
jgi:hypothetical protein